MSALQTLVLAAQVAGVSPAALEAPAFESGAAANAPQIVLSIPLSEIQVAQAASAATRMVDGIPLSFSAASGPEMLWLRVSGAGATRQWSWAELREGVSAPFGGKTVSFSADERGNVTAGPVSFNLLDALWGLYDHAARVRIDPILYAVAYEDGAGGIARSVSLIRRDSQGRGWIAYRDALRLREIHYFVAVNGVLYGMRLEGERLSFYAKRSDAATASFSWRRISRN